MPRAGANPRFSAEGPAGPSPSRRPCRRQVLAGVAGAALLGLLPRGAAAQDIRYFRIGTGTTSGTYFPIGGLIANAISNPPGSRPCDRGGSCGVPGLIAVAQATLGSVENIELLRSGAVEAGMSQADIAYWAYTGSGIFHGKAPFEGLRSIGMLYAEAIQLVVRADSDLHSVADLKGKAVSLGEEGSGVLVEARAILDAFGVKEAELRPSAYLKPGTAADRLAKKELDAFFMVGGFPVAAVTDVANREPIRLIPLDGEMADRLRIRQRFYMDQTIPADTYPGVPEIHTLGVGAELLVRADRDPGLIHGVTKALWHENTRRLLIEGHPKGRSFDATKAVANVSVPLHPGAERYYREVGLIGNAANEPTGGATP
ncbi:TAXI family TRAP transporter solute-binding subunit [Azospirillum brasilense]|uniref:Immunogenic protein n=1 Tax=Azospirillum brasilense TaxID=192 RepID=A0A235HLD4_AZOBR|nr:TAXI family TRAP transporter solute-binding subunit [Azospirillum brasilense]OYD85975.1 immunogenic protein [Azospirillum brasilense]